MLQTKQPLVIDPEERNQLEVLYRQLGVGNRAEAISLAQSYGLSPATSVEQMAGPRMP